MLKIELELGNGDGGDVGMQWVDCPPLEHVSDEEWNNSLLISDQVKNGLHALIWPLGPIPEGGWKIRYWMDTKKFPKSVLENANTDLWKDRGFAGPSPKPKKVAPVSPMHNLGDCLRWIETEHNIETDKRQPRSDSLWLWLMDNHGDDFQRESVFFLFTNANSEEFEFHFKGASAHILKVVELLHKEFADHPDDEGITFWVG